MKKYTKLEIYDFDQTLCISPENTQENRIFWETVTGEPWRYKTNGWWSKLETLDCGVYDIKLYEPVKQACLEAMSDTETYTVLLTGRMPHFLDNIKKINTKNGLVVEFDTYYLNDTNDTKMFKLSKMKQLKNEYPDIDTCVMYEDRLEHIPEFEKLGNELWKNFFMNIVNIS